MGIGPPVTPPAPERFTVLDIITDIHIEADWIAPGEEPDGAEAQFTRRKMNSLLDEWNAQGPYVYAEQFQLYTLTPGLSPHTIGPSDADPAPTFVTPLRPEFLKSAALILNSAGAAIDVPMAIWNAQQWAVESVKALTTSVQDAVYYEPTFPAGSLYFWPVPSAANQVRLGWWLPLTEFPDVQLDFWMPPAYRRAIILTIAEELDGPRSQDPKLAMKAAAARAAVRANNNPVPRIDTSGSGMPDSQARPYFNFLTGLYEYNR